MLQFLIELHDMFTLADFFDIAFISLLIYVIFVWFEAAASRFVLLGILMLGAIYFVVRFFNMYLSASVLKAFFAILLIALVVIFQEELRRFFERLSVWGALSARGKTFSDYPEIETITYALSELARERKGALVIVRGLDPLDRHLTGGYDLDGRLSEALLKSIFDPASPGHDGAAIVEHGRMSKFGCHLPLSDALQKIGTLGTRHSAALGLAERSDALCIAVSEERGTISLARGENLVELSDASDLASELKRFYAEKFPKPGKKTWKQWVGENLWEKVLAIALSCILWFVFVFQTGTLRRDFVVPIEYKNLASDWVIEESQQKKATVTLLGRARAFDLLDENTLNVTIDMSKIKEGKQEVQLSRDLVRRPSGLSVVELSPLKITLTAHQMLTLDVPVEPQVRGAVPPGLELVGIKVVPETVPVMVSSKFSGGSLKAQTEAIDLSRITETTTLKPGLILPEGARFATDTQPQIQVKVSVEKKESMQEEG